MNPSPSYRAVIQSILSGAYTPYDVREFVRLCYALAFPLVRKRILLGRINLESLGLKQSDVVYDCIADLFVRDNNGHFSEVEKFFGRQIEDRNRCSDALLWDTLRRIVFARVNVNLIRLHSGADAAFGKILHNIDAAVTRTALFEKYVRFGETMLASCDCELLLHLPSPPLEYIREQLSRVVLIHDSVPAMLKKLHTILETQQEFQRTVPLTMVGLLLKEVYALGEEVEREPADSFLRGIEEEEAVRLIEEVCGELRADLRSGYVESGKIREELFEHYLQSTRAILSDQALYGRRDGGAYFDHLQARMPTLTREEYVVRHKSVQEYFLRVARAKLAERMRREQSAGRAM